MAEKSLEKSAYPMKLLHLFFMERFRAWTFALLTLKQKLLVVFFVELGHGQKDRHQQGAIKEAKKSVDLDSCQDRHEYQGRVHVTFGADQSRFYEGL